MRAASSYIAPRLLTDPLIRAAVERLAFLIEASSYERATRLRGLPAKTRADIAFGRLRKAEVKPERLLVIHMALSAILFEAPGAPQSEEFKHVQFAKPTIRLASGWHGRWESLDREGRPHIITMHKYPVSSGHVLRLIGAMIDERCAPATIAHLQGVLALKVRRYGRHPGLPPAT